MKNLRAVAACFLFNIFENLIAEWFVTVSHITLFEEIPMVFVLCAFFPKSNLI